MRTTVIPAQITTVEDKIAGSLNFTQILLLMVPVFWTTIVYVFLSPRLHLVMYKYPLVLLVLVISLILSLRVKGKIILSWLVVLFRYNLRSKYYIFNKNESYLRTLDLPVFEKKPSKVFVLSLAKKEAKATAPNFGEGELAKLENMIKNPKLSLNFKFKKGGLNVAFEQIAK